MQPTNRPLKKAHLLRCARPPLSDVLFKYAFARQLLARLASGTFLTGLEKFFSTARQRAGKALSVRRPALMAKRRLTYVAR